MRTHHLAAAALLTITTPMASLAEPAEQPTAEVVAEQWQEMARTPVEVTFTTTLKEFYDAEESELLETANGRIVFEDRRRVTATVNGEPRYATYIGHEQQVEGRTYYVDEVRYNVTYHSMNGVTVGKAIGTDEPELMHYFIVGGGYDEHFDRFPLPGETPRSTIRTVSPGSVPGAIPLTHGTHASQIYRASKAEAEGRELVFDAESFQYRHYERGRLTQTFDHFDAAVPLAMTRAGILDDNDGTPGTIRTYSEHREFAGFALPGRAHMYHWWHDNVPRHEITLEDIRYRQTTEQTFESKLSEIREQIAQGEERQAGMMIGRASSAPPPTSLAERILSRQTE